MITVFPHLVSTMLRAFCLPHHFAASVLKDGQEGPVKSVRRHNSSHIMNLYKFTGPNQGSQTSNLLSSHNVLNHITRASTVQWHSTVLPTATHSQPYSGLKMMTCSLEKKALSSILKSLTWKQEDDINVMLATHWAGMSVNQWLWRSEVNIATVYHSHCVWYRTIQGYVNTHSQLISLNSS